MPLYYETEMYRISSDYVSTQQAATVILMLSLWQSVVHAVSPKLMSLWSCCLPVCPDQDHVQLQHPSGDKYFYLSIFKIFQQITSIYRSAVGLAKYLACPFCLPFFESLISIPPFPHVQGQRADYYCSHAAPTCFICFCGSTASSICHFYFTEGNTNSELWMTTSLAITFLIRWVNWKH